MTNSDDDLLAGVRGMWQQADPPPAGLVEAMVAAVASADLDEEYELLVLVRDSADEPTAQVRGVATTRVLYFRAVQGWTLEAEVDGDQISGQLVDFHEHLGPVQVSAETMSGERWSADLDEVGFFTLRAQWSGWIRFRVSQDGIDARSGWVEV